MESLGDILEKLLPVVFLLSTFLLPAFLKKKKEQKKKGPFKPPPSGQAAEGRASAGLEEKIKRQFDRIRGEKKKAARKAPKPAPQPGFAARPPASRPSLAEPLRPLSRTTAETKTRPAALGPAFPDPTERSEGSPADDAYRIETDAYGRQSDTTAFGDTQSAFGDTQSVFGETQSVFGETKKTPSKTRLSGKRGPLAAPAGKKASRAPLAAPLRGIDDRSDDEYALSEDGDDEALEFDVGSMPGRDLRRAIVLREILGRPVALKGFCSDHLW